MVQPQPNKHKIIMSTEELKQIGEFVATNLAYCSKAVLTATEAAAYLGVSLSCLYKWTMNRVIPHYKPNGKLCYFERAELEKWMMSNKVATGQELEQKAQTWANKKGGIK